MIRACFVTVLAGLTLAMANPGRAAGWRFHWQTGQVLVYRIDQVTTASEVVDGKKTETTLKLNDLKRWQVLDVDATGVATVQMSLGALRLETTTPKGEVLLFDSAHPETSNPQMREHLAKLVGPPLAVLKVDSLGRAVEVKECNFGPASRFESEPPFVLTLPEEAPQVGQVWERAYKITLEPPQGTGDKFDASQKYECQTVQAAVATIGLTTALKAMPESLPDQIPLLQMQTAGPVVFDTQAGRFLRANLHVDKELKNHQGEGSSYHFQSNCTEEYIGDK